LTIRHKLLVLFIIILTLSLGNAFFVFKAEDNARVKNEWVTHTHDVLNKSLHLLSSLQRAETNQRGYVLTFDEGYLQSYNLGLIKSRDSFVDLQRLTKDNFEQQNRLKTINSLMEEHIALLNKTIELVKADNSKEAIVIIKSNESRYLMERLQAQLQIFRDIEHMLLDQRKHEYDHQQDTLKLYIVFETVVLVVFAIFIWVMLKVILMNPLQQLLSFTKKIESGKRISVEDVVKDDEIGSLIKSFFRMSEKVHTYTENLKEKAYSDSLTGLPNRALALKELKLITLNSKNTQLKTAICFIDINKFKPINDKYGHEVGDKFLQTISERLTIGKREEDSVYRIGGDEFLLIVPNIREKKDVIQVIDNINREFAKKVIINGNELKLSVSIGVSLFTDDSTDPEELLRFADLAMYNAKKEGKSYSFFH